MALYAAALRDFDDGGGHRIFGAGHDELADLARSMGVVYKPCGAGGGDIGVALSQDAAELDVFDGHARRCGFVPLELQLDDNGLVTEQGESG